MFSEHTEWKTISACLQDSHALLGLCFLLLGLETRALSMTVRISIPEFIHSPFSWIWHIKIGMDFCIVWKRGKVPWKQRAGVAGKNTVLASAWENKTPIWKLIKGERVPSSLWCKGVVYHESKVSVAEAQSCWLCIHNQESESHGCLHLSYFTPAQGMVHPIVGSSSNIS